MKVAEQGPSDWDVRKTYAVAVRERLSESGEKLIVDYRVVGNQWLAAEHVYNADVDVGERIASGLET